MSNNLPTFGKYNLHARLYPGLLAALPVSVLVAPLISSAANVILPLAAASGVFLLVVQQVRSMGIRAEERLKRAWGGIPTTLRLRLRDATNRELLARRRKKLADLYGQPLPDAAMEEHQPLAADEIYVAATRFLITKVRQNDDKFPLVQEEVTNYGFRRNMFGLKRWAVAVVVACLIADGALLYFAGATTLGLATTVFHGLCLTAWPPMVTESWVREIAERYADRLFEALDAMDELDAT